MEERVADITLCAVCGFAIQLRWHEDAERGESRTWQHFRPPIVPHSAEPKRSMWDYDCYGQPL